MVGTPSIREMKDALTAVGVSFADCSEKAELVARYHRAMAKSASRGVAPPKTKTSTPSNTSRAPAAPPKQISIEEMGKEVDGSDGGELGAEIRRVCSSKDFYEVLRVQRQGIFTGVKEEDLKKAYRKLALRLHPDKCHLSGAEDAFKKVSAAFSCLKDSQQRASYDVHGEELVSGGANGYGRGFGRDVDAEELFQAFCGEDGEGFKVANLAAAIKRNPWLLLTFIAEPPMYPVGTIVLFAVISAVYSIVEAVVR